MEFLSSLSSIESFMANNPWAVLVLVFWSLAWKAPALWKAARLSHMYWFALILISNTFGILEIIYIFLIAKKYSVKVEEVQ